MTTRSTVVRLCARLRQVASRVRTGTVVGGAPGMRDAPGILTWVMSASLTNAVRQVLAACRTLTWRVRLVSVSGWSRTARRRVGRSMGSAQARLDVPVVDSRARPPKRDSASAPVWSLSLCCSVWGRGNSQVSAADSRLTTSSGLFRMIARATSSRLAESPVHAKTLNASRVYARDFSCERVTPAMAASATVKARWRRAGGGICRGGRREAGHLDRGGGAVCDGSVFAGNSGASTRPIPSGAEVPAGPASPAAPDAGRRGGGADVNDEDPCTLQPWSIESRCQGSTIMLVHKRHRCRRTHTGPSAGCSGSVTECVESPAVRRPECGVHRPHLTRARAKPRPRRPA